MTKEVFQDEFEGGKFRRILSGKLLIHREIQMKVIRDLRTEKELSHCCDSNAGCYGTGCETSRGCIFMKDVHSDVLYTR